MIVSSVIRHLMVKTLEREIKGTYIRKEREEIVLVLHHDYQAKYGKSHRTHGRVNIHRLYLPDKNKISRC